MHFNSAKITSIAVGIIAVAVFGFLSFIQYESGSGSAVKVQAEIIGHTRNIGSKSGAATADPMFTAVLSSGLRVQVRDYGILPLTYKGVVVLERREGTTTGRPIYTINKQATEQARVHNK